MVNVTIIIRDDWPAKLYSTIMGSDLRVHASLELVLPLNKSHEHAILLPEGDAGLEVRIEKPHALPSRILWDRTTYGSECSGRYSSCCRGARLRQARRSHRSDLNRCDTGRTTNKIVSVS